MCYAAHCHLATSPCRPQRDVAEGAAHLAEAVTSSFPVFFLTFFDPSTDQSALTTLAHLLACSPPGCRSAGRHCQPADRSGAATAARHWGAFCGQVTPAAWLVQPQKRCLLLWPDNAALAVAPVAGCQQRASMVYMPAIDVVRSKR
jgi:hypothetical protein